MVVKPFIALIAAGLDAACIAFSKSKIKETAASVVVGIGLLVGSTVDVQAACDPPVYGVCFHKLEGDWTTAGHAKMIVEFDGLPGKTYHYRFSGWMSGLNYSDGTVWYGYGQVTGRFSGSASLECADFWWDPDRGGTGGYLQIYEEGTSRSWRRGGPKVLGKWIASVDFYPYQEAALVYLNNSAIPFEFSQYYCTIDWDPIPVPLKYGYTLGCWEWVGNRPVWPKYNGWRYHGDHGSPRFDYRSSCSYEFDPSPSFGNRCP